jgi:hypothetical protein
VGIFHLLTEWAFFLFSLPPTILGLFLLTDEAKYFKAARICFWGSAIWMWGKFVWWGIHTGDDFMSRSIAIFVATGLVAIGLTEALRLVAKREALHAQTTTGNDATPTPTATPLDGSRKGKQVIQKSKGDNSPNQYQEQKNSGGTNVQQQSTGNQSQNISQGAGSSLTVVNTGEAKAGNLKQRTYDLASEIMNNLCAHGLDGPNCYEFRQKYGRPTVQIPTDPDEIGKWMQNRYLYFRLRYRDRVIEVRDEFAQLHIRDKQLEDFFKYESEMEAADRLIMAKDPSAHPSFMFVQSLEQVALSLRALADQI